MLSYLIEGVVFIFSMLVLSWLIIDVPAYLWKKLTGTPAEPKRTMDPIKKLARPTRPHAVKFSLDIYP